MWLKRADAANLAAEISSDEVTKKQTEILKKLNVDRQKLIAFLLDTYHDGAVLREEIEQGLNSHLSDDELVMQVNALIDSGDIFKSIVNCNPGSASTR